jgi:thiamine pyrophosphokinase
MTQQACLFLNGEYASQEPGLLRIQSGCLVIGVDGGTHYLSSYNLTPGVVIGDMDSIPATEISRLEIEGIQILRHRPEKDETDFELALDFAIQSGCDEILVFGALGGRTDQAIANILLPLCHLDKARILLFHGIEEISYIKSEVVIHGDVGDTLSLIPIGGDALGVRTIGMRYPLESETLIFGKSRGISNELTAQEATIKITTGLLLCIHSMGPKLIDRKEIK